MAQQGSMPMMRQGRRDATGTRSGFPCQDVWYYHTHLAIIVNDDGAAVSD